MTTVQDSTNGTRVSPPPSSVENHAGLNRAGLPTDKDNIISAPLKSQISDLQSPDAGFAFRADACHVPPEQYAPKANAYGYDDFASVVMSANKLPDRCQFMFSDGRQCTMARSDIHPSLCRFHSEREDQLFGDPAPGGGVVGRSLDLPELYSACRDLTTAAGVNRALAQVFRLLAQRRISRQEAATFGRLAHLLLRSISLARVEATDLATVNLVSEHSNVAPGDHAVPGISRNRHANGIDSNPSAINTCENARDQAVQNQHLQKNDEAARRPGVPSAGCGEGRVGSGEAWGNSKHDSACVTTERRTTIADGRAAHRTSRLWPST